MPILKRKLVASGRISEEHQIAVAKSEKEMKNVSIFVKKIGFLRDSAIEKTKSRIAELKALEVVAKLPIEKQLLRKQGRSIKMIF